MAKVATISISYVPSGYVRQQHITLEFSVPKDMTIAKWERAVHKAIKSMDLERVKKHARNPLKELDDGDFFWAVHDKLAEKYTTPKKPNVRFDDKVMDLVPLEIKEYIENWNKKARLLSGTDEEED